MGKSAKKVDELEVREEEEEEGEESVEDSEEASEEEVPGGPFLYFWKGLCVLGWGLFCFGSWGLFWRACWGLFWSGGQVLGPRWGPWGGGGGHSQRWLRVAGGEKGLATCLPMQAYLAYQAPTRQPPVGRIHPILGHSVLIEDTTAGQMVG